MLQFHTTAEEVVNDWASAPCQIHDGMEDPFGHSRMNRPRRVRAADRKRVATGWDSSSLAPEIFH